MARSGRNRACATGLRPASMVATFVAATLIAPSGQAQPARLRVSDFAEAEEAPELSVEPPRRSLADRLAVARSESLLLEGDADERLRALARLGESGRDEALQTLVEAMSPGRAVRNDPRARLVGVRMLAPHAAEKEDARKTLTGVLNDVRAGSPEAPLERLARATAAMALAAAGTEEALTPLVTAVIGGGRTGALARAALIAHPPSQLGPLADGAEDMSPRIVSLLGDLGDPRAIGLIRKQRRRDKPPIRRAAAIASSKLGDGSAAAEARAWLVGEDAESDEDRVAAAEVLVRLDAPQAAETVAELLGRAKTRRAGLRLARLSASPALVPTLAAVVAAEVTAPERARAAALLAEMGTESAAKALVPLLSRPELATLAALGLARNPSRLAREALAEGLRGSASGAPRRLMARAAVVRWLTLGETTPGLDPALAALEGAEDDADRAVAAFGLVSLGRRDVAALARSEDTAQRYAAWRAALALGARGLSPLRLASGREAAVGEPRPDLVGASVALLLDVPEATAGVSTSQLARWAERGGLMAPLAAYRLAVRDSAPYRDRLRALLQGTDPLVRRHVALGLAQSPEPDAVALLADRYRFETDAAVRRAVIRALSWRSERLRERTLDLAERLDPDAGVRALARSARRGRRHDLVDLSDGEEVAWVTLRPNGGQAAVSGRPALLVRGDGLALPVVAAPDGVILVPGLSAADRLRLRLTP